MSDVFPKRAVGSMVGLAGFAGAMGGALIAAFVGLVLETTGSYVPIFTMFGFAYLLAWIILRVGIPHIRPLKLD